MQEFKLNPKDPETDRLATVAVAFSLLEKALTALKADHLKNNKLIKDIEKLLDAGPGL